MVVKDTCFVLDRFLIGENTLLGKCYFQKLGKRKIIIPKYFSNFKFGSFEPFNVIKLYLIQRGDTLQPLDVINISFNSKRIAQNYQKFLFLSKVSKIILEFISEADHEIFKLLLLTIKINHFFSFNYIRFLLNLTHILGFSIENLNRPGWINLVNLSNCRPEELKNSYCIYIHPKEFALLKRISDAHTKPFEIDKKIEKNIEVFFYKFLEFRKEQF